MKKWLAVLTISLCFLIAVPFVAALQVPSQGVDFALPEENGNIILLAGTTFSDNGAVYLVTNTSGGQIYSWYFPFLSMGNGTTMLQVSAQNCNVTITSFNSSSIPVGENQYNRTRVLHCNIVGEGATKIDFGLFSNQTVSVYINDALKQQGEGWSLDNFGITVTGSASDVAIYSQYTDYGPRGLQQLNALTYAGIIIGLIIATLIIFGMTEFKGYRHKQKTETKPSNPIS